MYTIVVACHHMRQRCSMRPLLNGVSTELCDGKMIARRFDLAIYCRYHNAAMQSAR